MSKHTYEHRTVAPILDAIANWVKKYREAIGLRGELANCGAEEVARYARDIGVSPEELIFMTKKGPHAADELPKLLRALGVDPQKLTSDEPATMRSLQRICISCGHKGSASTISPWAQPLAATAIIVRMRCRLKNYFIRKERWSEAVTIPVRGTCWRLLKTVFEKIR